MINTEYMYNLIRTSSKRPLILSMIVNMKLYKNFSARKAKQINTGSFWKVLYCNEKKNKSDLYKVLKRVSNQQSIDSHWFNLYSKFCLLLNLLSNWLINNDD